MKKLKITSFSDGGHGWYAVKRAVLKELNILDKISSCSFQNGQTVYLEEDCDAATFFDAYTKKMLGYSPKEKSWENWQNTINELFDIKKSYTNNSSPIRNYPSFNKNMIENLTVGMKVSLYGKTYTIMGQIGLKYTVMNELGQRFALRKTQESELQLI